MLPVRTFALLLCTSTGVWVTPPAWAQTLAGTVTDTTAAAVAGAAVSAVPSTGGRATLATTGEDGTFRLALPAAGAYDVTVARAGFVTQVVRQQVTGDGETRLSATLDLTSFTEEVRVAARLGATRGAASHLGLTAAETPASLDVVTQDVIQARGADTASTALRFVTGVTSSLRPGASAVFSTRGFVENSMAVLFNGVRVQSSTITMRNYDAFNFDRVEVIRGPASVVHGEGAAIGAINFVRREPTGDRRRPKACSKLATPGVCASAPRPQVALGPTWPTPCRSRATRSTRTSATRRTSTTM